MLASRRLLTSKVPVSYIWIKRTGSLAPSKIPIAGCHDIYDVIKAMKSKFGVVSVHDDDIALYRSREDTNYIPLTLSVNELITHPDFRNCDKEPLFAKVHHVNIFIRKVDEDGNLLDSYVETQLDSDEDVRELYQSFCNGMGLLKCSNPTVRLTKLHQLKDGEQYQIYSQYIRIYPK